MVDVISFQDAISDSNNYSKRHLLLGNGFSIACRADIFHYESLPRSRYSQIFGGSKVRGMCALDLIANF